MVDRLFARSGPDQLRVTDITEHPTREGKVYCCVVLDAYSRRVVGWSIDSTQTATLVTNALGMAIHNQNPQAGTVIVTAPRGCAPRSNTRCSRQTPSLERATASDRGESAGQTPFWLVERRAWDSNPRDRSPGLAVFKTAAIVH